MNESLSQHLAQNLEGHLIKRSSFGQIESNTMVKRDITGSIFFYKQV